MLIYRGFSRRLPKVSSLLCIESRAFLLLESSELTTSSCARLFISACPACLMGEPLSDSLFISAKPPNNRAAQEQAFAWGFTGIPPGLCAVPMAQSWRYLLATSTAQAGSVTRARCWCDVFSRPPPPPPFFWVLIPLLVCPLVTKRHHLQLLKATASHTRRKG